MNRLFPVPASVSLPDTARQVISVIGRVSLRGALRLADVVAPPVCLACRERLTAHGALCPACWRDVAFIRPPLCDRLGLPLPYGADGADGPLISAAAAADPPEYARARAVASYQGTMRRLIHGFKYNDRHDARALFGRWLAEAGAELLADPAVVLVPVPLTWAGLVRRRFNQAAVLAREVGRRSGRQTALQALVRTRRTAHQVGLSRRQRQENVRNAFAVPERQRARVRDRPVLLVDDVITTGATARACARALLQAGAVRTDVLALAMVTDYAHIPG